MSPSRTRLLILLCGCGSSANEPAPVTCTDGEESPCFEGEADQADVGACRWGITRCGDGEWGACERQVLPAPEGCDEIDNDCDGETDEGVLSECGVCGECDGRCFGPSAGCEPWGGTVVSLVETTEGWLRPDEEAPALHVLWPFNHDTGQIFRVDTRTLEVQGAYWTGPSPDVNTDFHADYPIMAAVDRSGAAIVVNMFALEAVDSGDVWGVVWSHGRPSMTKIAADRADCVDRDGDGLIESSFGLGDLFAFRDHDDWDDECVVWHTRVGGPDTSMARSVALSATRGLDGVLSQRGWVGVMDGVGLVQEFDPETGELTGLELLALADEMATDPDGRVWYAGAAWAGSFDATVQEPEIEPIAVPVDAGNVTTVDIDVEGHVWFGGWNLSQWTPDLGTWELIEVPLIGGRRHGARVALDGEGFVWATATGGGIWKVDAADLDRETVDYPDEFGVFEGVEPQVDFDGHVWIFGVTQDASHPTTLLLDSDEESFETVLEECDPSCTGNPILHGDLTGMALRHVLDAAGSWTHALEGCAVGPTQWIAVDVDAGLAPGATVEVSVRAAQDVAALAAAPWISIGILTAPGTIDLGVELAGAGLQGATQLEVRALVRTQDEMVVPTLRTVGLRWACPEAVE